MARTEKPRFAQNRDLLQSMGKVAGSFKDWRPAPEVLTKVQAVPTIFPQYDIATRVMGHPIARFCRVRGPSNEGKTSFLIGMMLSFLQRGHFAAFADAERTTPPEWLSALMGDYSQHPGFVALPVKSYEQTVDAVRDNCEKVARAREKGDLPKETSGIICVDSIRKLVPRNLMKTLLNEGAAGGKKSKGVDGFGGRAGQIKAALNAAWVDELIPLLADTNMAMLIIARETDDPDAGFMDEGIKVGGGRALYYDSSLDIRCSRTFITDPDDKKAMFGERHKIEIRKTKVGKKELKTPIAYFHTSNGTLTPEGFDRPRDVLELAKLWDVVTMTGAWYNYNGQKIGNGDRKAVLRLHEEPDLLQEIEQKARDAACASW